MASGATSAAGSRIDFFVSHAGRDQVWAEWLAWQLTQAGYTVELDAWDWAPGQDFVARMDAALRRADRVLAVWSEAYFRSPFAAAELRVAFVRHARDEGRIVPVLVEATAVPDLYASLVYLDLVGLDEAAAGARLRTRLAGGRPGSAPPFPTSLVRAQDKPAFAARFPAVWNVPLRNPHFVGRGDMLSGLRERLRAGKPTLVVHALYGLGGVGKTQLAIEYAHRFAADYDLVWWLDAEQPVLLATQLAALAGPLDLPTGRPVAEAVPLVLAELRRRPRWLLTFDNAQRPQDLVDYLPGGAGHVLITSRQPGWGVLGGRLEVDMLARSETVVLLRRRLPELVEQLADELADELGDLPLAAAQAAGYLESTALPPATYLERFRTRRAGLLARGDVIGYQGRLDTTWTLSLDRLQADSPAAVQLLQLAAFLAPKPIPLRLFTEHVELLADPLRTAANDPDELDDLVGLLVGFSLVRRQGDRIQLHRLVQAAIRHRLPPTEQQAEQDRALTLLAAAHPGNPDNPATWSAYGELAPHVLASELAVARADSRRLLLDTARYLLAEGDLQSSRVVTDELVDHWRCVLGPDHADTLEAAATLTFGLSWLGDAGLARELGDNTLHHGREALGPDHPTTLYAATALASALIGSVGELEKPPRDLLKQIHDLSLDTLHRGRKALGPDHPTTLYAAACVTFASSGLRDLALARIMGQDALDRSRRALGPDHLITLVAAANLTSALAWLGETDAPTLGERTQARAQQRFGDRHPVAIYAATTCTIAKTALTLAQVRRREAGPVPTDALITLRHNASELVVQSRQVLGPDYLTTVLAETTVVALDQVLPRDPRDQDRDQHAVARFERLLGPDHPATRLARGEAP